MQLSKERTVIALRFGEAATASNLSEHTIKTYTLRPMRCCFVSYVITFPQNSDLKSQYVRKLYLSSRQADVFSDVSMLIFDRRRNLQA